MLKNPILSFCLVLTVVMMIVPSMSNQDIGHMDEKNKLFLGKEIQISSNSFLSLIRNAYAFPDTIKCSDNSFDLFGGLGERIRNPVDVAVDPEGNKIYILYPHCVQVYDTVTKNSIIFGSDGEDEGEFQGPSDIEIDLIGKNVYVTDTYNHRIQVFDSDGNHRQTFGSEGSGDGEFYFPEGMTIDPTNNSRIYVADTGNERIQVFDSDGNHQMTFGQIGKSPGEFYLPKGIAVDSTGDRIYIADTENHRIQVFDSEGNHKMTFGDDYFDIDIDSGVFLIPRGIAMDTVNNTIYVTDNNHRIQVFDSEGNHKMTFGEKGVDEGEFNSPQGITVSPSDNRFYVADTGNNKVQIFRIVAENIEIEDNDNEDNRTKDFLEIESSKDEKLDKEDEGSGGCLIATAAHGTELAPQIQQLREIRDNNVMSTASGATFMTGFNSLYYSFSPYIADYQRENQVFKEIVKMGITPMLSTLSIMSLADTESEIVGYGIGVILLNLGMYITGPILLGIIIHNQIRSRI